MVIRSAICWESETRKENAKGVGEVKEMRREERLKGERDEDTFPGWSSNAISSGRQITIADSQSARGFGADPIQDPTFNERLRAPLLTYAWQR